MNKKIDIYKKYVFWKLYGYFQENFTFSKYFLKYWLIFSALF